MNYRHAFHAGNFADVHKHVVFMMLLEHLRKKPTPFFVLDTHAGRGRYDLTSPEAQRGNEWRQGVGRLREAAPALPILQQYLSLAGSDSDCYQGSPLIAAELIRDGDRAVFIERHPEEASELRRSLGKRRHISVLEDDGYAALKAHLPPKENRGVVLIDPPYEQDSEFSDITEALQLARRRWPTGIYCIWYPIKPAAAERRLFRSLVEDGAKRLLAVSLRIRPSDSPLGLNGSGLLLVNPPWQLDDELRMLLPKLHRLLAPDGAGGVRIEWIAGE